MSGVARVHDLRDVPYVVIAVAQVEQAAGDLEVLQTQGVRLVGVLGLAGVAPGLAQGLAGGVVGRVGQVGVQPCDAGGQAAQVVLGLHRLAGGIDGFDDAPGGGADSISLREP